MKYAHIISLATILLVIAPITLAASHPARVRPTPQASVPAQAKQRAVLRDAQHTERLARVKGIVRGMTSKLDNLSQRLDRQLDNVERRLEALTAAGQDLSVDTELDALRQVITETQTGITNTKEALAALADSESPRQQVAAVREMIKGLRDQLVQIRNAFHTLQLAVKDDVRSSPQPSISPTL